MMSSEKGDDVLLMLQQRKNKHPYRAEGVNPPPQQLPPSTTTTSKVAVVYYISRNGHLEQPHFIEVPLSSPSDGLHLKDVIARLNNLRGRGLADMYSWSSKRGYKSGYVWQDLSEDDLIQPCNDGHEYVLKGSELPQPGRSRSFRSNEMTSGSNQFPDYRARSTGKSTDAMIGTDDKRIRKGGYDHENGQVVNQVMDIERASGRMKAASSALIHLIMCGPKSGVVDGIDNVHV